MSRSGYDDGGDGWELIRYRGAVNSAIRGQRGQQFLRDLIAALDALPNRRLIADELESHGEVCALGSVGKARGISMSGLDPHDAEAVSQVFNIAPALAREITWVNDEDWYVQTPEQRWQHVRKWAVEQLDVRAAETR